MKAESLYVKNSQQYGNDLPVSIKRAKDTEKFKYQIIIRVLLAMKSGKYSELINDLVHIAVI
jgi:hypothetical protein